MLALPVTAQPAQVATAGRVVPCTSMISTITTTVTKMIRSRSRTGMPACVLTGTASAAASETAPRKPAQPMAARTRKSKRRA